MKILISTDIEGIAGVLHSEQVSAGNPEYECARRLMMAEANAAVEGAYSAGAKVVYVNDSHGNFRNMPANLFDSRAQLIQGKPRYLSMVSGVELGVNGVCFIGYHARAKSRGILAHTINGFAFSRIYVNNQELGEAGIYGALAGFYNAPVIMASGDDVFIKENQSLFPNAEFVQTKRALGYSSGISLSPEKSCNLIHAAVARAVDHCSSCSVFKFNGCLEVRIQTQNPSLADLFCQWPSLERIDADSLRFNAPDIEFAVRVINCLSAMSTMLR